MDWEHELDGSNSDFRFVELQQDFEKTRGFPGIVFWQRDAFVAYDQKDTCVAQTYVINFENRIGELGPGDGLLCFLCELLLIIVIE